MAFILGKKIEMSQVFSQSGDVTPVTLVEAGPVVVVQVKTVDKDGYNAVQLGFGQKSQRSILKPQRGHMKKAKQESLRWLKEFRVSNPEDFHVGDSIDVSVFKEGDKITVSACSKGKGFQGVVKRHGFHGGPRTHGQKHSEREAGSIGATGPQRVFKGKKMPGRMGGDRVTLKNLKIIKSDRAKNILAISGAIPGRRGTLIEIKKQS
ncbi:50S ribosomal protein L3 [Patescibacteria group bacterium]|nr:50S ribosomal protein L3 [Patescibacteria group bacterium]